MMAAKKAKKRVPPKSTTRRTTAAVRRSRHPHAKRPQRALLSALLSSKKSGAGPADATTDSGSDMSDHSVHGDVDSASLSPQPTSQSSESSAQHQPKGERKKPVHPGQSTVRPPPSLSEMGDRLKHQNCFRKNILESIRSLTDHHPVVKKAFKDYFKFRPDILKDFQDRDANPLSLAVNKPDTNDVWSVVFGDAVFDENLLECHPVKSRNIRQKEMMKHQSYDFVQAVPKKTNDGGCLLYFHSLDLCEELRAAARDEARTDFVRTLKDLGKGSRRATFKEQVAENGKKNPSPLLPPLVAAAGAGLRTFMSEVTNFFLRIYPANTLLYSEPNLTGTKGLQEVGQVVDKQPYYIRQLMLEGLHVLPLIVGRNTFFSEEQLVTIACEGLAKFETKFKQRKLSIVKKRS